MFGPMYTRPGYSRYPQEPAASTRYPIYFPRPGTLLVHPENRPLLWWHCVWLEPRTPRASTHTRCPNRVLLRGTAPVPQPRVSLSALDQLPGNPERHARMPLQPDVLLRPTPAGTPRTGR